MNKNNVEKWLKYLLYVGIGAMVNYLLATVIPAPVHNLLGYLLTAASLYLMYKLTPDNGRYYRVILFSGVSLIISALSIRVVALAGSLCAILGQYQEYTAHGELIADRDARLANKWGSLFWLQLAVELIGGVAITIIAGAMTAGGSVESTSIAAIATVAASFITVILKVMYLVYLRKTVKALEAVVE